MVNKCYISIIFAGGGDKQFRKTQWKDYYISPPLVPRGGLVEAGSRKLVEKIAPVYGIHYENVIVENAVIFRRDFHWILSELQETSDNCWTFLYFPQKNLIQKKLKT